MRTTTQSNLSHSFRGYDDTPPPVDTVASCGFKVTEEMETRPHNPETDKKCEACIDWDHKVIEARHKLIARGIIKEG